MERSGIIVTTVRRAGTKRPEYKTGRVPVRSRPFKKGDRLLLLYMIPSTVSTTVGNQCIFLNVCQRLTSVSNDVTPVKNGRH